MGIKPHQLGATLSELRHAWREAEDGGFESVWVFDHVNRADGQPCLEALTLLSAMACETSRVRLGVLVLNPGLRHPAWLGAALATLDQLSEGRIEVGAGAGSGFGMADLAAFGLPTPPLRDRLRTLDEYCHVLKLLWRGERVDFNGQRFRLAGAQLGALPVQKELPLIVGGGSRGLLEIAARHATEWNLSTPDPHEFGRRSRILDELTTQAGRRVARSAQVFLQAVPDSGLEDLVRRFAEAGAERLVLILQPPYEKGTIGALARRVLSVTGG